MSFIPIKNLLLQNAKTQAIPALIESHIFKLLDDAVREFTGEIVSRGVRPLYLKSGVLVLVCLGAAQADILRLKEKEILANVNERLGKTVLDKLYCLG